MMIRKKICSFPTQRNFLLNKIVFQKNFEKQRKTVVFSFNQQKISVFGKIYTSAYKDEGSSELSRTGYPKVNKYFNQCFDKGRLKNFVLWFLLNYGEHKTINLVEQLKNIGFYYASSAGISLGIDDLKIPPKKADLIYDAEKLTLETVVQYKRGEITGVERFQRLIDTWHRTSEMLKQEVINYFEKTDILNPVYMMAFSGARGNISQVRQLVGMRGLMADPQGQIIDFPIRSNFREGLTLTEYIISSYGARKGIVDTALRTANAGYLTRRLVDVAQHVIITNFDCQTKRGIYLTNLKEGNKIIHSLSQRIVGRILARDLFIIQSSPFVVRETKGVNNKEEKTNLKKKLASRNDEITTELAFQINKNFDKVFIRSSLTCEKLVCQLCYGWSLGQGKLVSIGEAIGVIAAQSIGEPGTQLTMRTFHTGGVFSGDISDQIKAPFNGVIEYISAIPGSLIRTPEGKIAFLTKGEGSFIVHPDPSSTFSVLAVSSSHVASLSRSEQRTIKKYKIPPFTLLYIRNGQSVIEKEVIAQISSISQRTNATDHAELTIKSEIEGQFYSKALHFQEVEIQVAIEKREKYMDDFIEVDASANQDEYDDKLTIEYPILDKYYQAGTWGYAWILSGKIYEFKKPSPSFPIIGDLLNSKGSMTSTTWGLSDKNVKNISFLYKKRKPSLIGSVDVNSNRGLGVVSSSSSASWLQKRAETKVNFKERNKANVFKNVLPVQTTPIFSLGLKEILFRKFGYIFEFSKESQFQSGKDTKSNDFIFFINPKNNLQTQILNGKGNNKYNQFSYFLQWFYSKYSTKTGGSILFENSNFTYLYNQKNIAIVKSENTNSVLPFEVDPLKTRNNAFAFLKKTELTSERKRTKSDYFFDPLLLKTEFNKQQKMNKVSNTFVDNKINFHSNFLHELRIKYLKNRQIENSKIFWIPSVLFKKTFAFPKVEADNLKETKGFKYNMDTNINKAYDYRSVAFSDKKNTLKHLMFFIVNKQKSIFQINRQGHVFSYNFFSPFSQDTIHSIRSTPTACFYLTTQNSSSMQGSYNPRSFALFAFAERKRKQQKLIKQTKRQKNAELKKLMRGEGVKNQKRMPKNIFSSLNQNSQNSSKFEFFGKKRQHLNKKKILNTNSILLKIQKFTDLNTIKSTSTQKTKLKQSVESMSIFFPDQLASLVFAFAKQKQKQKQMQKQEEMAKREMNSFYKKQILNFKNSNFSNLKSFCKTYYYLLSNNRNSHVTEQTVFNNYVNSFLISKNLSFFIEEKTKQFLSFLQKQKNYLFFVRKQNDLFISTVRPQQNFKNSESSQKINTNTQTTNFSTYDNGLFKSSIQGEELSRNENLKPVDGKKDFFYGIAKKGWVYFPISHGIKSSVTENSSFNSSLLSLSLRERESKQSGFPFAFAEQNHVHYFRKANKVKEEQKQTANSKIFNPYWMFHKKLINPGQLILNDISFNTPIYSEAFVLNTIFNIKNISSLNRKEELLNTNKTINWVENRKSRYFCSFNPENNKVSLSNLNLILKEKSEKNWNLCGNELSLFFNKSELTAEQKETMQMQSVSEQQQARTTKIAFLFQPTQEIEKMTNFTFKKYLYKAKQNNLKFADNRFSNLKKTKSLFLSRLAFFLSLRKCKSKKAIDTKRKLNGSNSFQKFKEFESKFKTKEQVKNIFEKPKKTKREHFLPLASNFIGNQVNTKNPIIDNVKNKINPRDFIEISSNNSKHPNRIANGYNIEKNPNISHISFFSTTQKTTKGLFLTRVTRLEKNKEKRKFFYKDNNKYLFKRTILCNKSFDSLFIWQNIKLTSLNKQTSLFSELEVEKNVSFLKNNVNNKKESFFYSVNKKVKKSNQISNSKQNFEFFSFLYINTNDLRKNFYLRNRKNYLTNLLISNFLFAKNRKNKGNDVGINSFKANKGKQNSYSRFFRFANNNKLFVFNSNVVQDLIKIQTFNDFSLFANQIKQNKTSNFARKRAVKKVKETNFIKTLLLRYVKDDLNVFSIFLNKSVLINNKKNIPSTNFQTNLSLFAFAFAFAFAAQKQKQNYEVKAKTKFNKKAILGKGYQGFQEGSIVSLLVSNLLEPTLIELGSTELTKKELNKKENTIFPLYSSILLKSRKPLNLSPYLIGSKNLSQFPSSLINKQLIKLSYDPISKFDVVLYPSLTKELTNLLSFYLKTETKLGNIKEKEIYQKEEKIAKFINTNFSVYSSFSCLMKNFFESPCFSFDLIQKIEMSWLKKKKTERTQFFYLNNLNQTYSFVSSFYNKQEIVKRVQAKTNYYSPFNGELVYLQTESLFFMKNKKQITENKMSNLPFTYKCMFLTKNDLVSYYLPSLNIANLKFRDLFYLTKDNSYFINEKLVKFLNSSSIQYTIINENQEVESKNQTQDLNNLMDRTANSDNENSLFLNMPAIRAGQPLIKKSIFRKYSTSLNTQLYNSSFLSTSSSFDIKTLTNEKTVSQQNSISLLGDFYLIGDSICESSEFNDSKKSLVVQASGQVIHYNNKKVTIRRGQPIFISPKGILHKFDGDFIDRKSPVITLSYQRLKTGDIIQGIPKVEQFFEARTTKRGRLFRDSLPVLLEALFKRYRFKFARKIAVRQSFSKIQQIIVDGVQRVYKSQGVTISDKHLEVIVKQMTSKVRILNGFQTGFFPGEIVNLHFVENLNELLKKKIDYEPLVLGITKASLEVDSFLSASSFQHTTRVLSKAAIYKKKDFLKGLKENVILGNLIPAGTGFLVYLDDISVDKRSF